METLVAWTYRLMGGENLWVARILSTTFWIVGAAALYDLGRRIATPAASLVGVGYYLFMPFSIRASRSFQPDPLLVMFIMLAAWALYHWWRERSWKWAILAGLLGGLSGLVKPTGLFFSGGIVLGILLQDSICKTQPELTKRRNRFQNLLLPLRQSQVWVMVGMILVFALSYYLVGHWSGSTGSFSSWTILTRWREVVDPSFFIQWMLRIDDYLILSLVAAGFIGTLVTKPENRVLLWGLWGGYVVFGLVFPYHIVTHDYYHLPLVGVVSLSLVPLSELIITKVTGDGKLVRTGFIGVVLLFFAYQGWIGVSILLGQDFREHPAFWQEVGESIPEGSKTVGLTQDYGFRLMYYGWRKIDLWPSSGKSNHFENETKGAGYFVITAKNQLSEDLGDYLEATYPVHAKGVGYVIYDLGTKR